MIITRNFKFILLFVFMSCSFNGRAAFVSQADTIQIGNFLLLTPLQPSFSDRMGLRTKEHLMINENERVKYTLKDSKKSKRGEIIRITDSEVQIYNQVTGKLDFIPIDDIETITRVNNWKAWAGYLSFYSGISLLITAIGLAIGSLLSFVINGLANGGDEFLILAGVYGTFCLLLGTGVTYAASNILYKYKKFRIGRKYKIGIYSMKKLNK